MSRDCLTGALARGSREPGQALTGAAISGVLLCGGLFWAVGDSIGSLLTTSTIRFWRIRYLEVEPRDRVVQAELGPSDGQLQRCNRSSPGEYVVVARRYRPQDFEQLVGQSQVSQALANAINTNRVGHAYLFTGARGVGKTSTARIFAKCLNCVTGPTTTPCGKCDICQGIASGDDVDVIEIDGASNRGIDEIRQLPQQRQRPSQPGALQDLHHRRSAHADDAGVQRAAQDAGRAAGARQIHLLHDRGGQDSDHGPLALPAVRLRPDRDEVDPRPAGGDLHERRGAGRCRGACRSSPAGRPGRCATASRCWSNCFRSAASRSRSPMCMRCSAPPTAAGWRRWPIASCGAMRPRHWAKSKRPLAKGSIWVNSPSSFWAICAMHWRRASAAQADLLLHTTAADADRVKQFGSSLGLETLLAVAQILDQTLVRMRQSTHVRTLRRSGVDSRLQAGRPRSTAGAGGKPSRWDTG